MNEIEKFIRGIDGAAMMSLDFYLAPSTTEKCFRKGPTDGKTVESNPFWERRKEIKAIRRNVRINLGVNYQNAVNGRIEKFSGFEGEFQAAKPSGKREHDNPHKNLLMSDDGTKTYVRYLPMPSKKETTDFYLDGENITEALKPYMAIKKETISIPQFSAGLSEEHQIDWRTLSMDGIIQIKCGGKLITATNIEAIKSEQEIGEENETGVETTIPA